VKYIYRLSSIHFTVLPPALVLALALAAGAQAQPPVDASSTGEQIQTEDPGDLQRLLLTAEEVSAFSDPPWESSSAPPINPPIGLESDKTVPLPPDQGGPLNWQVTGVTSGLRLRVSPSIQAETLTAYPAGTVLSNLGCRQVEARVWCDVQMFGGGARGFVAAEYLTPAISPNGAAILGPDNSALRAGKGEFDASGRLRCSEAPAQPMDECPFAVARTGGGYATVVVTRANGFRRAIYFQMGIPIGADTSQADGYPDFTAEKRADVHLISVGAERYEIVDAVILGG